jgi:FkbM family methyltransferase
MTQVLAQRMRAIVNKPEYWFQPTRVVRKVWPRSHAYSIAASTTVRLPWGTNLDISPTDTIGRSLLGFGVYDLAVSEILWRLTDLGERCLDIGANIGYMTSLLAVRAGVAGTVYGFEPHPDVFRRLKNNLEGDHEGTPSGQRACIVLIQSAVGADDHEVDLMEPEEFETNQGVASITNLAPNWPLMGRKHRVKLQRLDSFFHQGEQFHVAKIDVEGAELAVLHGAANLLGGRKIRDIVFEDFQPFPSESVKVLRRSGYHVYRLGKSVFGPITWNPSEPQRVDRSLPWEPVNYLATVDPDRADRRLRPRGWHCLRAKL